jgi:hypothetical protein
MYSTKTISPGFLLPGTLGVCGISAYISRDKFVCLPTFNTMILSRNRAFLPTFPQGDHFPTPRHWMIVGEHHTIHIRLATNPRYSLAFSSKPHARVAASAAHASSLSQNGSEEPVTLPCRFRKHRYFKTVISYHKAGKPYRIIYEYERARGLPCHSRI